MDTRVSRRCAKDSIGYCLGTDPARSHTNWALGCSQVVRQRIGQSAGMYRAVRLCKSDMDSRGFDIVVSHRKYVSIVISSICHRYRHYFSDLLFISIVVSMIIPASLTEEQQFSTGLLWELASVSPHYFSSGICTFTRSNRPPNPLLFPCLCPPSPPPSPNEEE